MPTKPDPRPPTNPAPDVSQVVPDEYPRRALPPVQGQRQPGFQVVARRSALNDIYRHGHASPHQEVCGVLVGNVYRDDAGAFLSIEASIRGEHAGSQDAQVTFTPETWTYLQEEMDKHHANRRMVGWYHTHPRFGIFLSDMDLFIQENFFGLPWQVAFVYDPVSGEGGMFVWRQGTPVREAFLVEEDAVSEKRQGVARHGGPADSTTAVLAERLAVLEKQQKWLLGGVAAVAFLVLIWPLLWGGRGRSSEEDSSREWTQHFLVELAQLRTQTKDLRNEVLQLRLEMSQLGAAHRELGRQMSKLGVAHKELGRQAMELRLDVAQLSDECERRLPPLARMPVQDALVLDLVPGLQRPLVANMIQGLFPDRRRAKWFRP